MARKKNNSRSKPAAASAEEVALRAGVSVMTVSRALRGENVSAKTREKILKIAKEVGYQPNSAARFLRTGRVEMVAFLTWSHDSLRGTYHSEALAGFDSVMAQEEYTVLLAVPPTNTTTSEHAARLVGEGKAGGLIIQGARLSTSEFSKIQELSIPAVFVNYTGKVGKHVSSIGYDNEGGIEQSVRHLVALGHKRIAFIGGTANDRDAIDRQNGFKKAMKKLKLPVSDDWIRPGDFSDAIRTGNIQADHLIAEGENRPTAIVCASDEIAYGVLESARRNGLRLPEDLSVVGFDNQDASAFVLPALTTIEHSGWEIGCRAAELLLKQIRDDSAEGETIILPTQLVHRQSTAPPK